MPECCNHPPTPQEWVTATDIRVTLDRLNTFGDEVFWDPQVLKSYYYAIIDFAVGARSVNTLITHFVMKILGIYVP